VGVITTMQHKTQKKFFAKKLRTNMTIAERKICSDIRNKRLGVEVRRQVPIGKYMVDFVCFDKKVIIEIDGGEHSGKENDKTRDTRSRAQGYKVLRSWNNEVLRNIEGVLQKIVEEVSPSPLSPPIKGGEDTGSATPAIRARMM
jgi:very-short-patch-repair endonuclease